MSLLQNTTQMRWQTLIPTILSADAVERLDRDFRGAERLAFGLILEKPFLDNTGLCYRFRQLPG